MSSENMIARAFPKWLRNYVVVSIYITILAVPVMICSMVKIPTLHSNTIKNAHCNSCIAVVSPIQNTKLVLSNIVNQQQVDIGDTLFILQGANNLQMITANTAGIIELLRLESDSVVSGRSMLCLIKPKPCIISISLENDFVHLKDEEVILELNNEKIRCELLEILSKNEIKLVLNNSDINLYDPLLHSGIIIQQQDTLSLINSIFTSQKKEKINE